MKLRLVSRLLVASLVVIVGLIIIIHQHATAGGGSHLAQPTPTVYSTSRGETVGGRTFSSGDVGWKIL
jgi:hypothetical protein